ncbi:MAG TPA: ThiF family adenylyltransferase [Candidatus Binatus sp.]|nr:ThiF family adenylyltransferase [Candidatus Binatus sp.]
MDSRYDRSIRFFGEEGQRKLRHSRLTIVGVGGVGGHVAQQLALLGVGSLTFVDAEELDETNRNRYPTARASDIVPGTRKVDIAERLVLDIDPSIKVNKIYDSLVSERAFDSVMQSDFVFGCIDSEGIRLILTELCAAYRRPYVDIASDIEVEEKPRYGGRVCISTGGQSCLVCLGQLDVHEAQQELGGPEARKMREALYGINKDHLGRVGPSVVSINGVVASLGVTEFMLGITGVREMLRLVTYRGDMAKVLVNQDSPQPDCYYCKSVWGRGDEANVWRYVRAGDGKFLR